MLQIVLIPGKKKRKKEKGQPTTASWAQPFISQQINMASADCLHMAPCRRASPHFLISQQRINVLLTENIVLHRSSTSFTTCGLDSDTPTLTSALCRTSLPQELHVYSVCVQYWTFLWTNNSRTMVQVCTKRIIAVKDLSQQLCFLVPG